MASCRRNPPARPWADLREAQRQAVAADAHAALAVTIDIGDPADLHPTNKREVGRRLAIAARHLIYGDRTPPSGPVAETAIRRGKDVVISFRDVTGALTLRDGTPSGFELCGATQASCRWADARIDKVSIVLPNASAATRVRYAWGGSPVCPLSDRIGAAGGPFRVDDSLARIRLLCACAEQQTRARAGVHDERRRVDDIRAAWDGCVTSARSV